MMRFLTDVLSAATSSLLGSSGAFARPRGATVVAWALVAIVLSAPSPRAIAQSPSGAGPVRRVVILNAADPHLPAFIALDRAMREAILAGHGTFTIFHAEALDMYRFPQSQIDDDVLALLRKKYRDLKVDVIVAAGAAALRFAEKHRAELWPAAAIVFHSVPEAALQQARIDPRTIGVPARLEFGATLDLALKLRPATRHIAVVAGAAEQDGRILALARAALGPYAGRLDIRYLVGLTLTQTVDSVQALPSDAMVLYLTVFRDGADAPLVPRDVLTRVAAASRAPVFGVFETYLGAGIVAGSIASYGAQGRRAGELVNRVLNGEDPSAISAQSPVAPGCLADWRELRRWRIDERLLPADCEVRFLQLTAWDHYRWQILAALAVILAQATLIVLLLLNRRRLRQAQAAVYEESDRRTRAETIADRLRERLARFSKERSLGTMATAVSHEINQPLIAIQNYAQAARRRLEGDVDDKSKLMDLFAKIEAQAQRAGAITQRVRSLVSASEPHLAPATLDHLLDEIVGLMEPEAASRGCCISRGPLRDLPAVHVDQLQVQMVLINLLHNALESVCAGEQSDRRIHIDAQRLGGQNVQVSVTDSGPGIAPVRATDIFEPFYSSTSGGMGMGLAISRSIIEAHGGRLWYEPNPAGGAIFRFTLQAAEP